MGDHLSFSLFGRAPMQDVFLPHRTLQRNAATFWRRRRRLGFERLERRCLLAVWNNAAGGSYNVAANWNPAEVPDEDTDVVFALNNNYTVLIDESSAAKHVRFDRGRATLDIQDDFIFDGMAVGTLADISALFSPGGAEEAFLTDLRSPDFHS
jgi:hypothetical protein